jgi:plasmid stabilization system protein ParE
MKRGISVTRRADRDLGEIWDYIATNNGADTADRVTGEIVAAFDKLAEMPGIGHRRQDIRSVSYRVWSIYSYLIIYRVKGRTLFISRVVHGARDLRKMFGR